jgi:hypothetical protein
MSYLPEDKIDNSNYRMEFAKSSNNFGDTTGIIKEVFISKDKTKLLFMGEETGLVLCADGDCCSESWFEHVTDIEFFLESKSYIDHIDDIDNVILPFGTRQEADTLYGYNLCVPYARHNKETYFKEIKLEMRNSSNGYYGGSIDISFLRGDYKEYIKDYNMLPLHEDF